MRDELRDLALAFLLTAIVLWVWCELRRCRRDVMVLEYRLAFLAEGLRPFLAEKVN